MIRSLFPPLVLVCVGLPAAAQPIPVVDLGLIPGDAAIAPAVNAQHQVAVARGGDAYLMVWADARARASGSQTVQSDSDIFGIRMDASGNALDAAPFLIAGGMGYQHQPRVAWNGQAWLVTLISQEPSPTGYFEDRLQAVRVAASGQTLDAQPITMPNDPFGTFGIGLNVAGRDGSWMITRSIYHNDGYGTFLSGQRIGSDGTILDPTPIMLIDWSYGPSTILTDDTGYLVAGYDWTGNDITRARRFNAAGQPLGPEFTAPGLKIATNGSTYYVIWKAPITGELLGSPMSAAGVLTNPAGTPLISQYIGEQTIAHDGTNWWVEWSTPGNHRTMRINSAGVVLDPGGVALPIDDSGPITGLNSTQLHSKPGGGVMFAWQDSRGALGVDANAFALPIAGDNTPGIERCLSTSTANQRNPAISGGPDGTFAVAYISEHANNDAVLVQFLSASGESIGDPIEVFRGPTLGQVGIAFNGSLYMVSFDTGPSGLTPTQVLTRRMSTDGSFVDAQPTTVMTGFNAAVGALGDDFLVAGTRYGINPQFIGTYGVRIDGPTGAFQDAVGGVFLAGNYTNVRPRVRANDTEWLVAGHSQWTHDSSQGDAFLARVPPVGPPSAPFNPTDIGGGSGDADIAYSGSTHLVVYRRNSLSNANNYIEGRLLNPDGSFFGTPLLIAEAPGRQLRPTVVWDGTHFLVSLDDQRHQAAFFDARTDVYAVRVTEAGQLTSAPFLLVDRAGEECTPALASHHGLTIAATSRFMTDSGFDSYRVGVTAIGEPPCAADLAEPFGTLNFFDVAAFIAAYNLGSDSADLAEPFGTLNFFDVAAFIEAYNQGCP
jgi:hypothetical protein